MIEEINQGRVPNDMVRDVRNYTFNHSIDSLSPDHAVGDPPLIDLLERLRETTDRDLGFSPAGSSPPAYGAPGHSGDAPGVDSPASTGGVSPPAPGEGASPPGSPPSGAAPTGSSSPGPATPLGSLPSGSAPSGTAPRGGSAQGRGRGRHGSSSRGGSARGRSTSRCGRGSRGGRGPAPARPITRSVAKQTNAKTIGEIRRRSYAFTVKGEFPDVAHRDGSFRFTEYALSLIHI